ncbi:MAG: hypothetical protein IJM03_01995 [Treponema sp.]|nr:hypothetical protein [Treponema sp.]
MKKVLYLICAFISINMVLFAKTYNTCKIVINRNENNGYMNVIESLIVIEKRENNNYTLCSHCIVSDFEILDDKEKYNRSDISLCGGERITLAVDPGEYRLKCITPMEKQNNYLDTNKQWESEYKYVTLKEGENVLLNIYPLVDERKYLGGWILK